MVQQAPATHADHPSWPGRRQTGRCITVGRPDRGSRPAPRHSIHRSESGIR